MKYLVEHSDVSYSDNLVGTFQAALDVVNKKEAPDDGCFYVLEITRVWKVTKPLPEFEEISDI